MKIEIPEDSARPLSSEMVTYLAISSIERVTGDMRWATSGDMELRSAEGDVDKVQYNIGGAVIEVPEQLDGTVLISEHFPAMGIVEHFPRSGLASDVISKEPKLIAGMYHAGLLDKSEWPEVSEATDAGPCTSREELIDRIFAIRQFRGQDSEKFSTDGTTYDFNEDTTDVAAAICEALGLEAHEVIAMEDVDIARALIENLKIEEVPCGEREKFLTSVAAHVFHK